MYVTLARMYDRLMEDVDYLSMANRIESVFRQRHCKPSLVLDLGCGTGSLALVLASRGYDLIALDRSAEMLAQAGEKAREAGLDILLLQQDIRSFELYGTVGAILATLDVLNHVTDRRGLRSVFRRVHNYLDPGGLFLFDLNSPYKLSTLLPAQPSYQVDEEFSWIWDSRYDKRRGICTFDLTYFLADEYACVQADAPAGPRLASQPEDREVLYHRTDEVHEERAWQEKEIRGMLESCGLSCLGVYDGFSARRAGPESERLFFVARRPI